MTIQVTTASRHGKWAAFISGQPIAALAPAVMRESYQARSLFLFDSTALFAYKRGFLLSSNE